MSKISKYKFTKNMATEAIIADVGFILINLFLFSYLSDIVRTHFKLFIFLAYPLQILAVCAASFGFFSNDSLKQKSFFDRFLESFKSKRFEMIAWWTSIVMIMFFGYIWMGPLTNAYMTVEHIEFHMGKNLTNIWELTFMIVNIIVISKALSSTYKLSINKDISDTKLANFIATFTVMLFLVIANVLLKEALIIIKPLMSATDYIITVICVLFMLLPVRLVLFLKPPFSVVETITFATVYAFFIKEIFSV